MNKKMLIFSSIVFSIILTPTLIYAQGFQPLVGIPGLDPSTASFSSYMNALYLIAISLAAMLAVVKIIIAGAKYMLSDVVTSKADAKKDIRGALFGLLIVMGAALILITINPQILNNGLILDQIQVQPVPVTNPNPPLVLNVGQSIPRASGVNPTTANAACVASGGSLVVTTTDLVCADPSTFASLSDYRALLVAQGTLTASQIDDLVTTYSNLPSNTTVTDLELGASLIDPATEPDLFNKMNSLITTTQVDAKKVEIQNNSAATIAEPELTQLAVGALVREESLFILTTGSGNKTQQMSEVCEATGKELIGFGAFSSAPHQICI